MKTTLQLLLLNGNAFNVNKKWPRTSDLLYGKHDV
jgi:hypothetical protein